MNQEDGSGNVPLERTVRPPVRHCDECIHYHLFFDTFHDDTKNDKCCKLGHNPRWYQPRSPVDNQWGHKRRCEDFKEDIV